MDLRPDEITGIIKSRIKDYGSKIRLEDTGTVVTVGDGIVRIHGLEKCMMNELLEFENGVRCMALNLEQDFVGAVMLGSDAEIKEGDTVKRTGSVVSVPVGEELLGRVVNALGQPIDGKGAIETKESRPIEMPAPGIIERAYGSFEKGPHDALPCDVWDPGEALVPFGGEGSRALAERMVAALAADIGEPGVRTLLAVSHGSASRQLIRATLPAGAEYPKRLPNCAVMVFDFDEEARRFTFCGLHDPAAITG